MKNEGSGRPHSAQSWNGWTRALFLRSPVLTIGMSYLLGGALLAALWFQARSGWWYLLVFAAGALVGFLAGLRVGLNAEEASEDTPISQPLPRRPEPDLSEADLPLADRELEVSRRGH